jgi:DNA polymerase-1
MPGPLLVVDAPSLLFRAYYGLPTSITDDQDRPVNALLGSANMLWRVVLDHAPRAVVLCFGPDAAVYRKELYEPYHADRPELPDEFAPQFAGAAEFFEAFGWISVNSEELEADDLLHSFAEAEEQAGGTVLLLTGDRDLYQCVTDRTKVLYMKTGSKGPEEVDADEVKRRYGIPPELVPDFIALRGDPSDGLPGAKGIGEKTAADLLQRHGSLEAALEASARERPPRVAGALRDQADELRRFKDIAKLRTEKVRRPPDRATDYEGGARAARERGMGRLAERLEREGGGAAATV